MIDLVEEKKELTFNCCEIFRSFCGEGIEVFKPAIFIRAAGCNMRCQYPCDTVYSFDGGHKISIKDVVTSVKRFNCKTLFWSGGEILIQREVVAEMVQDFDLWGYENIIQTNGSIYAPEIFEHCSLISVDYKGPSAGVGNESNPGVIEKILRTFSRRSQVQIKFLVRDDVDYVFARRCIVQLDTAGFFGTPIFVLGPVGGDSKEIINMLLESVDSDSYLSSMKNLRVGAQVHKLLWGNKRGV